MPHYKDGTEARVGDHVVGRPYNTDHDVAGTVVSITPGADSCNLQVEFIESVPNGAPRPHMALDPGRSEKSENHSSSGELYLRHVCRDYGGVKDFTLVARPSHVPATAAPAPEPESK